MGKVNLTLKSESNQSVLLIIIMFSGANCYENSAFDTYLLPIFNIFLSIVCSALFLV